MRSMPISRLLGVLALSTLCGNSSFSASAPQPNSTVAQANNQAGLALVRKVVEFEYSKKSTLVGNVLVSPISMHYALSMALNGTRNPTRSELLKYFGFDPKLADNSDFNTQNQSLMKTLNREKLSDVELKKIPDWQPKPLVLTINNGAWRTSRKSRDGRQFVFSQDFLKTISTYYSAENNILDFKTQQAVDTINGWVKKNTYGMIPSIINLDVLSDLVWVLINTAYTEGQWQIPFQVMPKPLQVEFVKLDGTKTSVPTINRTASTPVFQDKDLDVVEIQMAGREVSAFVALPKHPKDFESLQTSANGIWSLERWEKIFSGLKSQELELSMPSFNFAFGVELKSQEKLTKELGLQFLFDDSADFSAMCTPSSPPTAVGLIKQVTKVEWDEKGVKAAAATVIGGVRTTSRPQSTTFVVDRPFYVAIYDKKAKAFLFAGQVTNPTEK